MSAQNDRWAAISIYPLHGKGRWPTVIMYTEVTDVPKPAEGESGSKDHAHADVVPVERGIQNCGAAGVLCKVKSGGGMIQERRTADMPCKRKGEGGIAQDSRARFVVYQMFSSMYIVYILSCILQWLPLNGHEEAVSQHHSISILLFLGICKQQNCSCLIHNVYVIALNISIQTYLSADTQLKSYC